MATALSTWPWTATPPAWVAILSASSPLSQLLPFCSNAGPTLTAVITTTTGLAALPLYVLLFDHTGFKLQFDVKSPYFFLLSPLHVAASNGHPDIMNLLISSGSHFDSTNAFQQTACDLLDAKELSRNVIQPINHTTLQCLAARTIIKHRLNYRGNIPEKLEAFVLLHR